MDWDDELRTLARRACQAFGEDAVVEAFVRALAAAPTSLTTEVEALGTDDGSGDTAAVTKFVDRETAVGYLKQELRELLTAH